MATIRKTRPKNTLVRMSSCMRLPQSEQIGGQLCASETQAVREGGAYAGGLESSDHGAVRGDAAAVIAENLLHGDDFPFHARELGDACDPPRAIRHARHLYDNVDRRGDL